MSAKPAFQRSFRGDTDTAWCATCGHFGALSALDRALGKSGLTEERLACVVGPGCAGRVGAALEGYRIEVPAGAALPTALGLHAARPELRVLAVVGDRDASCAGAEHLAGIAARNPEILYVVFDNGVAAVSGPSPENVERSPRANPVEVLLASGIGYLATGLASDLPGATDLLTRALEFPGFAAVVLKSACTTFHRDEDDLALRARVRPVPANHDRRDREAAMRLLSTPDTLWTGALLEIRRPTWLESAARSRA